MVKNSQLVAISQTRTLENERRKLLEQYNQKNVIKQQQHEAVVSEINSKLKETENELFEIKEKYINLQKENEIKDAFMRADNAEIEAGIREALAGEKEVNLESYAKRLNEQSESIKMAVWTIHDLVDRACGSEERIKQEVITAAEMFFKIKLYPKLKSELIEELKGHKEQVDKNTITEELSDQE